MNGNVGALNGDGAYASNTSLNIGSLKSRISLLTLGSGSVVGSKAVSIVLSVLLSLVCLGLGIGSSSGDSLGLGSGNLVSDRATVANRSLKGLNASIKTTLDTLGTIGLDLDGTGNLALNVSSLSVVSQINGGIANLLKLAVDKHILDIGITLGVASGTSLLWDHVDGVSVSLGDFGKFFNDFALEVVRIGNSSGDGRVGLSLGIGVTDAITSKSRGLVSLLVNVGLKSRLSIRDSLLDRTSALTIEGCDGGSVGCDSTVSKFGYLSLGSSLSSVGLGSGIGSSSGDGISLSISSGLGDGANASAIDNPNSALVVRGLGLDSAYARLKVADRKTRNLVGNVVSNSLGGRNDIRASLSKGSLVGEDKIMLSRTVIEDYLTRRQEIESIDVKSARKRSNTLINATRIGGSTLIETTLVSYEIESGLNRRETLSVELGGSARYKLDQTIL
nr:MAG TPA: hypothetical protein [Caudoviricetes sp.]